MPACHAGGHRFEPGTGRQTIEGTAKWLASGLESRGIGDPGGGSIPLPSAKQRTHMKKKRIHRRKLIPLKWAGTILCIIGIALTSFNVYPLNIFIMFIGTGIWLLAGILQRDWPLAAGELVSIVLYMAGIFFFIVQSFN